MNGIRLAAAALLCTAAAGTVSAQAPVTRVTMTGRVQTQWNSTSIDEADMDAASSIAATTFEARRLRLGVRVQVNDWIEGVLEPDIALGRLQVKQAWVSFELDPALVIRAGQMKKPFGAINLQSSMQYAPIERGVRIRGLANALAAADDGTLRSLRGELLIGELYALLDVQGYAAYDQGLMIEGRSGGLGWAAGVFNGTGADTRDENDGKSFAARTTYTVGRSTPVRIGAGWSRRELNAGGLAGVETRSGSAFAADLEVGAFRRRGWWLVVEAATGTNLVTDERFAGVQASLSRFVRASGPKVDGVEPLLRASWGDPDRTVSGDAGIFLTPGVNLYFIGRNRLMLNWDVFMPEADRFDTQHAARAQVNLYF